MDGIVNLIAIAVLAIPVALVVLIVPVVTTRGRVRRLAAEVSSIRQELSRQLSARQAGASALPPVRRPSVADIEEPSLPAPTPPVAKPVTPRPPPARQSTPSVRAAERAVGQVDREPPPEQETEAIAFPTLPPTPAAPAKGLEERFGTRWVVWAGGIALVLGGIFLVQYSIEQGLIGPAVRILLGALLAAGLLGAGEWIRRREHHAARARFAAADIPSILTAAGTTVAFATVYAAYALYGFLDPAAAFVLLGVVALATLTASLVHGPWVAALGLVGAFATPALVLTTSPSYWALAIYVVIVTGATLALARIRHWRWLALTGVVLGALWIMPGIAVHSALTAHAFHAVAGFALVAAFIVSGLLYGPKIESGRIEWESSGALAVYLLVWTLLTTVISYDPFALATFVVLAGATVAVAWRTDAAALAVPVATILTGLVLAGWSVEWLQRGIVIGADETTALVFGIGLAVLFAAAGYLAQGRSNAANVSILWAASAVLAPIAILVALYHGVTRDAQSIPFAVGALIMAVLYASATERLMQRTPRPGSAAASALFATASIAALALALTFGLEQGWLSVGLALMVPGIAWVATQRVLLALRWLAAALAVVVMARVAWEPRIIADLGTTPVFNWLLYGYGIPALSFWVASMLLRRRADDIPSRLVEAAAILFTVLLVFVELRHLMNGGYIYRPPLGLAESALQVTAVLALAIGLERLRERTRSLVQDFGALALAGLGLAGIVLFLLLRNNPWWTSVDVGGPVFNLILLGYLLPAVLILVLAWTTRVSRPESYHAIAIVTAAGLGLLYLLLETARLFRGPVLPIVPITDSEQYAYSAVTLIYGVGLLLTGIALKSQVVRFASAAVVLVATAKVFLIDMAGLTGFFRALSFIGLGLCLVGIGWLYQRLLFPRQLPTTDEGKTAPD